MLTTANNIDRMYPLITIGILTYNSEKTIIDTLESAKKQNYANMELIISDDASSDNTVSICYAWIEQNADTFVNVDVITVPSNTGTCANCNRLLSRCKGEWVQMIAGDDIFLEDSIITRVNYAMTHPDAEWIFSKVHTYMDTFEESNALLWKADILYTTKWKSFFDLSNQEQLNIQARVNMLAPPSNFFKVDMLKRMGGYEEKYFIIEDAPMNFKLLKEGVKCHYLDEFTVGYRIGSNNVCSNKTKLFNLKHLEISYQVKKDYCWTNYSWNWKVYLYLSLQICRMFELFRMNKAEHSLCRTMYNANMSIIRKLLHINISYR